MRLFTPIAVWLGARAWLPRFLPQITAFDTWLQKVTRGKVGLLVLAGLPGLMLTVPGRKSGLLRTTPLLCVPHEGGWLVAGSNFGGPKPPVWVVNLRATERAQVRFRGREYAVAWRELVDQDRAAAWAVMRRTWPNYDHYQARANRVIPVFFLTPA